jgi:putative tricarboxylic transport membrane protein
MLEDLSAALVLVFQWENFFWVLLGVTCGVIIGSIPGLTDTMAISLILPFTYYLGPIPGIAMLMGLSKGSNYGGSIPAILFNIPGNPQSLFTALDGYPLAKQGKSGKALKGGLFASVTADSITDVFVILLAAPVAVLALKVGPAEYSMLIMFALVTISLAATSDPWRGLLSVSLGLLLGTVGTDPMLGTMRFTFGIIDLADGFALMALVIGMLAFSEVLRQSEAHFQHRNDLAAGTATETRLKEFVSTDPDDHRLTKADIKAALPTLARSTLIGGSIGILPGIGNTVASYLGYLSAKKFSKNPERFGKGELNGVIGCEAASNAAVGPNLIPLITLGIPGNLAAALILGAFMIKGLVPGPGFMEDNAPMLYGLFIVLLISNFFTAIVGYTYITYAARKFTNIPKASLYTCILIFTCMGSYVFNGNFFDVWVMLGFGIFGYVFMKLQLNLPALIVAFFLGDLFENKFRRTLLISGDDWTVFFTRPLSLVFISLAAVIVIVYVWKLRKPSTGGAPV